MRSIKSLGLALIAVFAMSALAVPVAPADELTSETSPVTLSGVSEESPLYTTTMGNMSCREMLFDGTTATPATSITVTPTYPAKTKTGEQNCTFLGFPAEIHTNGCRFIFTINGGVSTQGDMAVECPAGQEITFTAVAAGTTKCTLHMPEQTFPPNTVTYSNIGFGATREVTVSVNVPSAVNSFKYSHTKGTGLGSCIAGSGTNGSFITKFVVTALGDVSGAHAGLFLS